MKQLPSEVRSYKKTPVFTQDSIPKGLLQNHNTKAGVWGKISVLKGELLYVLEETGEQTILTPERFGISKPQERHRVKPLGEVAFFIEFYR